MSNSSNMTFTNNEIGVAGELLYLLFELRFFGVHGQQHVVRGAEYGIRAPDSYYLND